MRRFFTVVLAVFPLWLAGCDLLNRPMQPFIDGNTAAPGFGSGGGGLAPDEEDFGVGVTPDQRIAVTGQTGWNTAVNNIAAGGNDKNYVIDLSGTVTGINGLNQSTNTFTGVTGVTVSLRGTGTLSLEGGSNGRLLNIGANQTIILRGLTLRGKSGNDGAVVHVSGGAFIMRSGTITGNTTYNGGGVYIEGGGTFTMRGGSITGNTAAGSGGGVYVNSGTFNLNSPAASGNAGNVSGNTPAGSNVYKAAGSAAVNVDGTAQGAAGNLW